MFHTIILSGGANHAAAFFGCIRYLEHTCMIKDVRKVVGSSAGSLLALFMALGMSSDEMRAWSFVLCQQYGFNTISMEKLLDICDTFGVDAGTNLVASIAATLDKYLHDIGARATFKDLAQAKGIDLTVCVLNVTKRAYEYLSVDTTPNMLVVDAIRMSMSIPLIFAPVMYHGCMYVDPVIGRNFPHDYSLKNDAAVLGLSIVQNTEEHPGIFGVARGFAAGELEYE